MWTGSTVDVRMPHLTMGATSFQISIFGLFDSYVTKPSEKCFCHMCRCIIFSLHLGHCVWLGIHTHVCTFQCLYIHIFTHCAVGIHLHVCIHILPSSMERGVLMKAQNHHSGLNCKFWNGKYKIHLKFNKKSY